MFAVNAHRIARRALLACCLPLAFAVTGPTAESSEVTC